MTAIGIYRATTTDDEYGDPVPGASSLVGTIEGKYAPSNPGEQVDVGRNQVITGGVVYVRRSTRPDLRSTDQVEIDSVRLDIDGEIGHWEGDHGYRGCQFAVKKSAG